MKVFKTLLLLTIVMFSIVSCSKEKSSNIQSEQSKIHGNWEVQIQDINVSYTPWLVDSIIYLELSDDGIGKAEIDGQPYPASIQYSYFPMVDQFSYYVFYTDDQMEKLYKNNNVVQLYNVRFDGDDLFYMDKEVRYVSNSSYTKLFTYKCTRIN